MSMGPNEQEEILKQLIRMDPSLDDCPDDEERYSDWIQRRYDEAHRVYNALENWRDYTLVELVDAVTFERKWYWRRKT